MSRVEILPGARRLFRSRSPVVLVVLAAIWLAACGTVSRPALDERSFHSGPSTSELDAYRFAATDSAAFLAWNRRLTDQRRALGLDGIRALAFSGGGANGAYGAGVIVGWTRSGERPSFDLVTGVSTGALIAPLAFAGPQWDGRLRAAYHDASLSSVTSGRMLALFHVSLYGNTVLKRLVDKYVDRDLLAVIAAEHAKGRDLLVATTNLDTQTTVIWDMGEIAQAAQRPDDQGRSLQLFRSVLLASASIPGVFPPTFIGGTPGRPAEMHVDGGVSTPFFLIPEAMTLWTPERSMRPTDLYVVVNGKIGRSTNLTPGKAAPIMMRAIDTLERAQTRTQMIAARAFAERSGGRVAFTAIPDDQPADPLNFSGQGMAALFNLGERLGASGTAFRPASDAYPASDAAP